MDIKNHQKQTHALNPQQGSILREGFRLKYYVEGVGVPSIVIGSAVYYSRSFSQNLRKDLCMAFIDWRGFSKDPANSVEVSLDTFLEDIEAMREHLGFKRCIIIGHSAHALLALEYAKKYPQYVSHVVMIGISPNLNAVHAKAAAQNWEESIWPERKAALEKRIRDLPDEDLAKLPPDKRFVKWYVRRDPQAWYDFSFDSSSLWEGALPNMPMFDYLYGVALRDLDITKGLSTFEKPVFLALGRYDFIVAPSSSWDPIRQSFHDLTVRIFERSGHSPQYEESSLFDAELLGWISNHTGAKQV